jgi:DNA/RNA endonuclease G (NUC1)
MKMHWKPVSALLVAVLMTGTVSYNLAQPPTAPGTAPAPGTQSYDAFPDTDAALTDDGVFRSATRSSTLRRAVPQSAINQAWVTDNCQFGMPKAELYLGPVKVIAREGYVLAHSSVSKIPYWVCEHSTVAEITGPADRDNSKFKPDPELAGLPRAELSDYKGSGFDRGHMAPAGDFKNSQPLMDQSFYLSNMVPQHGLTFNRGIWAELEGRTRDWVKKRGECWIISGPMFYDPLEETDSTADGIVPPSPFCESERSDGSVLPGAQISG